MICRQVAWVWLKKGTELNNAVTIQPALAFKRCVLVTFNSSASFFFANFAALAAYAAFGSNMTFSLNYLPKSLSKTLKDEVFRKNISLILH